MHSVLDAKILYRFVGLGLLLLSTTSPRIAEAKPNHGVTKKAVGPLYGLRKITSLTYETDQRLLSKGEEQWQMPLIGGDGSLVYVANHAGELFALWIDSGKILWRLNKLGAIGRAFHQRGDSLVFGARQSLIVVDRFSGKKRWSLPIGGLVGNKFAAHEDTVIIPLRPNAFIAVDLAKRKILWRIARPKPSGITVRGQATPTIDSNKGQAYLGFSDGTVQAVDLKSGKIRWTHQVGDTSKAFADVDTQPLLQDDGKTVLVASYNAGVFGLNANTGRVQWRNKAHLAIAAWIGYRNGERVVASNGEGQIIGFAPQSKTAAWVYQIKSGVGGQPTLLKDNWVGVAVSKGSTVILDRVTGAPQQLFNPGTGLSVPVETRGQDLILLSNKGNVLFYRIGEGTGLSH